MRELKAPCFPELTGPAGAWIDPRIGKFSRPFFPGAAIALDTDLAADGCSAAEGLKRFGPCHQLRHQSADVGRGTER